MELISGFIGTYLRLNEAEEVEFQQAVERMELATKERVMEFATDWQEKGRELGRQEGLIAKGQEDILRILEVRFEDIPPELRELIGKIDDLEVLGNLLVQAVTTQSVEVFESIASQYMTEESLESEETEQSPENDELD